MKPIRLALSDKKVKTKIDGSHFWGNPYLPESYGYPEYTDSDGWRCVYQFICQINLEDIASHDTENALPHKGILLFFAKIDHYLGNFEGLSSIGGNISGTDDVRVIFFQDTDGDDFREVVLVDEDKEPLNPSALAISFSEGPSLDEHFLFAEPTHREWESWDHPYEDWIILLQIDSFSGKDFNLNFMDCGVLVFLIHPDDLKKHDFSKVRAVVLST